MNRKILLYLSPFILLLIFLLDGQLSTLVTNWAPRQMAITSHVLFMLSIFYSIELALLPQILLFTFFGMLYDVYYLGVLGIALTLMPLVVYLIYYFYQQLNFNAVTNTTVLLVIIFSFEFASFLLGRLFGLTNLSMYMFVFYNLVPTIVFNSIFFLLLQPDRKSVV